MNRRTIRTAAVLAILASACLGPAPAAQGKDRNRKQLIALWDFASTKGDVVHDRSGHGKPLNLKIENVKQVRRLKGALEVRGKTLIRSEKPATKIIEAIKKSGEITLEAWVRPATGKQSGPARIVTLSKDSGARNFTMGQDGTRADVRFRTTKTSTNGIPSLITPDGSLQPRLTHLAYVRNSKGLARIYINGRESRKRNVAGDTSSWDGAFRFALANELSKDRPWLGTLYLVAVYSRDLTTEEVERNFGAGAGPQASAALAADKENASKLTASTTSELTAKYFNAHIAPLLARHCLECHGWKSKKGKLDLSRMAAAFKGGSSGKAIVPGKSTESLLWESVESDDMPYKREPLSRAEKRLLKTWIDAGAHWGREAVIPRPTPAAAVESRWLQRLTVPEYIETVRAAVGVDIAVDARRILPRDLRADGFSNTAYNLNVDLGHVDAYAKLAGIIVGKLDAAKFAARFSRSTKLDDASMTPLISAMGKRLLRGPLEKREVDLYLRIPRAVAKEGGAHPEAVRYIVQAMLQSPRFLYRVENQRGDGKTRRVGMHELASRMSYILWGGPPDEELMRAADVGELAKKEAVAAQVDRMLKDPRAVERSAEFVSEWLHLSRLRFMKPNRERFPKWSPELAADMRAETIAFFKDVAWKQNRPLSDLLNAQVTYATPRLAAHYGLAPKGKGLAKYDVSKVPSRGGLLTHGSVLTVGGDDASMVTRGLFVLHDVLKGEVKDPPEGVDTTPVPAKPGQSNRMVSEKRIKNPSCGGCHSKFEPFAFGLEKYDGVGAHRDKDEHGNVLREDGKLVFPGSDKEIAYTTSLELMNILAKSDRVRYALTWKVAQFALGRPLVEADAPALDAIHKEAQKGGGTYSSLIRAIVMSDLVQLARTEN